ncbi:MAG: translation initiation factor IF-2 subunit alpha [Desulfurococcaceae archaeon]
MIKPQKPLPDVGELVVATVDKVFEYGAYVKLDEYGDLQAYLPWSEASSRWVKDVKEVVKDGQKIVAKVIRVDRVKSMVDVSLKRVAEGDRRRKMQYYKRLVKGAKIIEIVSQKLGKSVDEAYRDVVWKLDNHYGDPLTGLEEAVVRGPEALIEAGVPEEWVEPLINEARKHITVKKVSVRGVVMLRSLRPKGLEDIKKILLALKEAGEKVSQEVKVNVYTMGAPRYAIEIEAREYGEAEKALNAVVNVAEELSKTLGVSFSFEREKK